MIFRALAVWLVLMAAESLHGTLRQLLLAPLLGDLRARQVSVLTGSLIILGLTYLFIRWLRAGRMKELLLIGGLWVMLTLLFEFALGRLVLGLTWERLLADYDVRAGGLMLFGLSFLFLAPYIAAKLHGWKDLSLRATF
ncbi:MAG: hypothetical protein HYR56_27575 [Acidobacteria bacterium]|nr:hypothetical protein [Acidobacteriota bacterium]MBI3424998.1 hypothetical protein [Acidobacteriota bacterium]